MKKYTTLYVKENNLNKIDAAAVKTGIKRNDIIIKLFELAVMENEKLQDNRTSVKYQKSAPKSVWNRPHVSLPEDIAVFCMDMRRFYCKSASFILAYSVMTFLEDLINRLLGIDSDDYNTDNYRFVNTIFNREVLENGICWKRYWQIPQAT